MTASAHTPAAAQAPLQTTEIPARAPAVTLTVNARTATISLNRPERRNALTLVMWQGVAEATEALASRDDIDLVVLASAAEGVFASGIDLKELETIASDAELREENRQAVRAAQRGLASLPMPTLAVIDGACVGGGCGLALHCDFRLASRRARFGITPARLGLTYPMSDLVRLVDQLGQAAARRLLLTADIVDADEALRLGLATWVVDDITSSLEARCDHILSLSATSLRTIKAHLSAVAGGQRDDDDHTIAAFLDAHESKDAREGIRAFLEKRPPKFGPL